METQQSEVRLKRLATRFSKTVKQTCARIQETQQALFEKDRLKKEAEKRILDRRIGKARRGVLRLLELGNSSLLQKVVEASGRLPGDPIHVRFATIHWTWIGDSPKTSVSFIFEKGGVRIGATDYCWMVRHKNYILLYSGQEVSYGDIDSDEKDSLADFLQKIADGPVVDLVRIQDDRFDENPTEEEVIFQLLVSWSRKAAFERTAARCLEDLEKELQHRNLQAA